MTKSRNIAPQRRRWTAHELAVLHATYADTPTEAIARQLGRSLRMVYSQAKNLGLRKSAAYLSSEAAGRMRNGSPQIGREWQFKPGQPAWNKGVKGSTGRHPATAAQHFKPGNRPHTWLPVGTTRLTDDGLLQRKVADSGYAPRDWQSVHRLVWEAAHGPVPRGHVVVFKPGRRSTVADLITLDAVECITRAELIARNSTHRHGPELHRLAQLRGAITRQINRKLREQRKEST